MNKRVWAFLTLGFVGTLWLGAQTTPQDLERRGREALSQERPSAAVEWFRQALELNPRYAEALAGLAESFFLLGEYEEAGRRAAEALRLAPGRLSLQVLQGRALLGQGLYEEGRTAFERVLRQEPKNLGALFGLAEYQLFQRRLQQSALQFEAVLREEPGNARALLALVMIYQDQSRWAEAAPYLDRLLARHDADPRTHYLAAWQALGQGRPQEALRALQAHYRLATGSQAAARELEASLQLQMNRPEEALAAAEAALAQDNLRAAAWHLRALALKAAGRPDAAVESWLRAVRLAPDREVFRLALETHILRDWPLEAGPRAELAAFHLSRASAARRANQWTRAFEAVRRALVLHPDNPEAQMVLAELYALSGFPVSRSEILEFVARQHPSYRPVSFTDALERSRAQYSQTLGAAWGLTLADQVRDSGPVRPRLGVFYRQTPRPGLYGVAQTLAAAWADEAAGTRLWDLAPPQPVSDLAQAFMAARNAGWDYYLVLESREGDRDVSLHSSLHLASTGREIIRHEILKQGLERVSSALRDHVRSLAAWFPPRGRLLARREAQGLLGLGSRDQVAPGQVFTVLKPRTARPGPAGLIWSQDQVLGTFTVGRVEDYLAEGTLSRSGFFDLITPGDELIFLPEPQRATEGQGAALSDLQRRIVELR